MDIEKKIDELKLEYSRLEDIRDNAHARMKAINIQIRKARTLAKHAEEIFAESVPEYVDHE
jgi:hypothetical protein